MSAEPKIKLWEGPVMPSEVQEPIQPWGAVLNLFNDLTSCIDDLDDIGVQQILCHDLDDVCSSLEDEKGARSLVEAASRLRDQLRFRDSTRGLPLFGFK